MASEYEEWVKRIADEAKKRDLSEDLSEDLKEDLEKTKWDLL